MIAMCACGMVFDEIAAPTKFRTVYTHIYFLSLGNWQDLWMDMGLRAIFFLLRTMCGGGWRDEIENGMTKR